MGSLPANRLLRDQTRADYRLPIRCLHFVSFCCSAWYPWTYWRLVSSWGRSIGSIAAYDSSLACSMDPQVLTTTKSFSSRFLHQLGNPPIGKKIYVA